MPPSLHGSLASRTRVCVCVPSLIVLVDALSVMVCTTAGCDIVVMFSLAPAVAETIARLQTQQVVVGLCVCQLAALRLSGECRHVCTCREVHVWVVQGVVQRSGEPRGNAWTFTAEDGGHNTGLVGVAGGREVGWESVGGGAAQWSRGRDVNNS